MGCKISGRPTERMRAYHTRRPRTAAWICNYINYKVWDEITYPLLNFKGATVEASEIISNSISHFTWARDCLSMLGLNLIYVNKTTNDTPKT